jgi:hypothetical protein
MHGRYIGATSLPMANPLSTSKINKSQISEEVANSFLIN